MKFKFFLFVIASFFIINFASAIVTVSYDAHYAQIEDNGSLTLTDNDITGFSSVGYVCLNEDCSSVGNKIPGLSKTTLTRYLTLEYPTVLQSPYGYGIWIYKDGYIHWEKNPNWNGNGDAGHYDVYLSRKLTGWSPIMDMTVVNEVHPDIPVEIGVRVGIDADAYSALTNTGILSYNPLELEQYNIVKTKIILKIINSSHDIIYEDSKIVNIPYSEYANINFSYSGFSQTGEYKIEISTEVIDDKIINSITQYAISNIKVIPYGLTDYSYSLINGLRINPAFLNVDELISFSFDYLSNYIDIFGDLSPLKTNASIIIYKDNLTIDKQNLILSELNENYSFSKSFSEAGEYSVFVEGTPYPCSGVCYSSNQILNFIIKSIISQPILEIISPENKIYNYSNILVNINAINATNVWWIYKNNTMNYSSPIYYNFSEGENRITAFAENSNLLVNKTINFYVNLSSYKDNNITESIPIIWINSPENKIYNYSNILINISNINATNVWISIDNNLNLSYNKEFVYNFVDGNHLISAYANNSAGVNFTSINFYVNTTLINNTNITNQTNITSPILIYFSYPTSISGTYNNSIIHANLTAISDNFSHISLNLYNSSSLISNINSLSKNLFWNFNVSDSGNYFMNATVYDKSGNSNSTETRSFYINLTTNKNDSISNLTNPPLIWINSPENKIYNYSNILINISNINATNIWWNIDNLMNISYDKEINYIFSNGAHLISAYANNSAGVNFTSINFYVNTTTIPPVCLNCDDEEDEDKKYKKFSIDYYDSDYPEQIIIKGVVDENNKTIANLNRQFIKTNYYNPVYLLFIGIIIMIILIVLALLIKKR